MQNSECIEMFERYLTEDKKASAKKTQKNASEKESKKKSSFKRRVYNGPSKTEIAEAATKKAEENFKNFFSSKEYDVKYAQISYNVSGDVLSVDKVEIVPKKRLLKKSNAIPYTMKAEQIVLRSFNVGEKDGKPMGENGELIARKVELPLWNEKAVKKGKVDITQLKMRGNLPSYLKAKGEGKLDAVEVRDLRSETIINETVLNNVVRSKVLSASSAFFREVTLQKKIADSLKQQELDGLNFGSATINGKSIPTPEGALASMVSYSARILDVDLVLGARLEAQKENPNSNPDKELLRKNAAENKEAIAAAETEMETQTSEAE